MIAVLIASTDIVRVKYGANNQIPRQKSKRETYFAVITINIIIIIIIIMNINLQNCLKN